jgi:hypothetical protein
MPTRKAVETRVLADIGKAHWHRVKDQIAEHTAASRQRPQPGAGVLVETYGTESLEPVSGIVEHAQDPVPWACSSRAHSRNPVQHDSQIHVVVDVHGAGGAGGELIHRCFR